MKSCLVLLVVMAATSIGIGAVGSQSICQDDMCGTRVASQRQPKIINGTDAQHGNYPWMVSLLYNNRHHCGGSLITSDTVLTAAHCVYRLPSNRFKVKLGGHLRNSTTEPTAFFVNPIQIVAHRGFSYSTFADDIALIRLPHKVNFTDYVRPICLPDFEGTGAGKLDGPTLAAPSKVMVIGWGKLRQGGPSADILQELELPIVENPQCIRWYREKGKFIPIRSTQICSGLEEGGADSCFGDSGSPMMMMNQTTKRWHVVGITSAGIGCALPKLPGLYTRVSSYGTWISKTIELMDRTSALFKPIKLPGLNATITTTTTTTPSATSTPMATSTVSPSTTIKPVVINITLNGNNVPDLSRPLLAKMLSILNNEE